MRHFVYMDKYLLTSYYSQAYGGLETSRSQEAGDTTSTTSSDGIFKYQSSIEGGIKALISGKIGQESTSPFGSFTESEIAREIVTRTMHDDIFDWVSSHARENGNTCAIEEPQVGKYLEIGSSVKYFDVDHLLLITGDDFMTAHKHFIMKEEIAKVERPTHLKPHAQEAFINKEAEKIYNQKHEGIELLRIVLRALKCVMPFTSFCYCSGIIIPVLAHNYKEPISHIMNKYDGSPKIFGKITKIGWGVDDEQAEGNIAKTYRACADMLSAVLKDLLHFELTDDIIILTPIVIYYE